MEFTRMYFTSEKAASFLFFGIGILSTLFSIYCWLSLRKPFYIGIAYPFLLLGILEIAVGVTIYWRTPKDIERVENYLVLEPEKIIENEIPRMEGVMKSFVTLRYVELFLIVVGVVMMYYSGLSPL